MLVFLKENCKNRKMGAAIADLVLKVYPSPYTST